MVGNMKMATFNAYDALPEEQKPNHPRKQLESEFAFAAIKLQTQSNYCASRLLK